MNEDMDVIDDRNASLRYRAANDDFVDAFAYFSAKHMSRDTRWLPTKIRRTKRWLRRWYYQLWSWALGTPLP